MNTPMPSRWACDALAVELAAEKELDEARAAVLAIGERLPLEGDDEIVDRYVLALTERNALRGGRP